MNSWGLRFGELGFGDLGLEIKVKASGPVNEGRV